MIKESEAAFTLAEMLVVIAIVALVGLMMAVIFTNTLRGSSKAQVLAVIKQNGQAVLDKIDKDARGSDDISCTSNPANSTGVFVKDGTYTRYRIAKASPPPVGGTVPAECLTNGCIASDHPVQGAETYEEFLVRVCSETDPMGASTEVLTDTNTKTGVSVYDGALFNNNTDKNFKDELLITFSLKAGKDVAPGLAGEIDPVVFTTTVQRR